MKKLFLLLSATVVAALFGCQKSGTSTVREGSPTVEGAEVTGVTTNSATCGGEVTSEGKSAVAYRGVVWSKLANPTVELSTRTSDGYGTGRFTSRITGLESNTTYYVRAYATNEHGTGYGREMSFTTGESDILVVTIDVSDITASTASCRGTVSSSSSRITAKGVVWSKSSSPTISDSKSDAGSGTGSFTCRLTGLKSETTYYVRAYATSSEGTEYGNEISFQTKAGGSTEHYFDEKGVDRGEGTEVNGIVWAPVNCGYDEIYTYGKLYQWGRKDGCGYGEPWESPSHHEAEPIIQTLTAGPISADKEKSDCFYKSSVASHEDWLSTQDDSRWNGGTEKSPVKTIYDPCPSGWRVPTATEFRSLAGSVVPKSPLYVKDDQNGVYFDGTDNPGTNGVFLPAAGTRVDTKPEAGERGEFGIYWSSSVDRYEANVMGFFAGAQEVSGSPRVFGYPVRCVKE